MGSLARLLGVDRTTLTASLKPLERRGLVAIEPDPTDRRGRVLALTRLGLTTLRAALPLWERTHAELEQQLRHLQPEQLRAALRALA